MSDQPLRYGERQIADSQLEAVPNPAPDREYRIDLTCPEFTCLCPRSGFPDFATLYIAYVPRNAIVELKSLKLYINKYRNEYVFHEAAVNRIFDDLVALVDPVWLEVIGDFTVRGNIHTVISVRKGPAGYVAPGRPGMLAGM